MTLLCFIQKKKRVVTWNHREGEREKERKRGREEENKKKLEKVSE
jgi:hypothetical protein